MLCTVKDVVDFYNEYPEYIGSIDVDTRFGYKRIEYADITAYDSDVYTIETNSHKLQCSPDHKILSDSWKKCKDIKLGDIVKTKTGDERIVGLKKETFTEDLYDLQVEDVTEYYSNGIVSHNSTMLDAIAFVLYGKPYRNINKPQLVNSVNNKNMLVEIEFASGTNEYLVRRGIKPNIFEIYENGDLIDQESRAKDYQGYLEKNILHMNYTAFTQIVVLGKATYVPFMRLKSNERRQLIEELLGLTIFSKMNDVLKRKFSVLKDGKLQIESEISVLEEKIRLHKKYIDQLSTDKSAKIHKIQEEIEKDESHLSQYSTKIQEIETLKSGLLDRVSNRKSVQNRKKELGNYHFEFQNKIKKFNKDIKFFTDNDVCPTCQQDITEDFKELAVKEKTDKIESFMKDMEKLNAEIEKTDKKYQEIEEVLLEIQDLEIRISENRTSIMEIEKHIRRLQNEKNGLLESDGDIDKERQKLESYREILDRSQNSRSELNSKMGAYQSISTMLKDTGIKSMIVQKYLPIFNNLINQYLTKFDFFVKFNLDETFNEQILSRYKDKFSYSSFSEGEKLRLDLAILLTWREISKMKNAMSTNLLIMDEIFDSSLDQTGVDAFVDLIPRMEKSNIFVISHTPQKLYDKFKNILEFEKDGNFSVMKA
jgi:DNA repair exonuclease SbcCD ATPase subunit